jgi:dephospho-CoA kinase
MPQEEKEKMADFVLNNLSLQDLEREVLNLHHLIKDKYC